jgi:hypothetical protein
MMNIIVCLIAAVILFFSVLDSLDHAHRRKLKEEERNRKYRKYK